MSKEIRNIKQNGKQDFISRSLTTAGKKKKKDLLTSVTPRSFTKYLHLSSIKTGYLESSSELGNTESDLSNHFVFNIWRCLKCFQIFVIKLFLFPSFPPSVFLSFSSKKIHFLKFFRPAGCILPKVVSICLIALAL